MPSLSVAQAAIILHGTRSAVTLHGLHRHGRLPGELFVGLSGHQSTDLPAAFVADCRHNRALAVENPTRPFTLPELWEVLSGYTHTVVSEPEGWSLSSDSATAAIRPGWTKIMRQPMCSDSANGVIPHAIDAVWALLTIREAFDERLFGCKRVRTASQAVLDSGKVATVVVSMPDCSTILVEPEETKHKVTSSAGLWRPPRPRRKRT